MSERHVVKASIFNIDSNEYEEEEEEFEVSDDVYKIITNGIGASYSIRKPINVGVEHLNSSTHEAGLCCSGVERAQTPTDSEH